MTEISSHSDESSLPVVPTVWVLIFDRYRVDAESDSASGPGGITPPVHQTCEGTFDRLDLGTTCFEQFLLQDVQGGSKADAVFGGEPALSELSAFMTAAGQTASLVSLSAKSELPVTEHADYCEMEASMRRCRMPLKNVVSLDGRNLDEDDSDSKDSGSVDQAFAAGLVWIEARTLSVSDSATATTQILDYVFRHLRSQSALREKCPVLIVTFRRGNDDFVREPLKAGLEENLIHVPIWIRSNIDHACRVQALAGSFDLLPTIVTFLSCAGTSDEASRPTAAPIAESSERSFSNAPSLSLKPRSLAFLCGAPQVCPDRLLKLRGDGWKAARTEEFLLVVADSSESDPEQTESDGNDSEEPSRRLYVKPEDRFNINDVNGTYVTAADELLSILNEGQ